MEEECFKIDEERTQHIDSNPFSLLVQYRKEEDESLEDPDTSVEWIIHTIQEHQRYSIYFLLLSLQSQVVRKPRVKQQ